jgi:hypothetical protein
MRMKVRLPARLFAFVALKAALIDKLLGLCAKVAIVAVCELTLLCLVDGVPFGADVNTTCQADLATGLESALRRIAIVTIDRCNE